jgi:hypothetical protein
MSLAQTASFFHSQGFFTEGVSGISQAHQVFASALSVIAILMLAREIFDRVSMDRKLKLAEEVPEAGAREKDQTELHHVSVNATTDILMMLNAVSADDIPAQTSHVSEHIEECVRCQQIAREMAAAWLEVHLYLENKESGPDRLQSARLRVSRIVQMKRQHELLSGHELPLMKSAKGDANGTLQCAGR